MEFQETRLPGVILITPTVFPDERGFFMETWQQQRFSEAGIDAQFVQDNFSRSTRGTLRGLHYQIAHSQGKLLRVVRGEVFDVAVDLRRSSPTFAQWFGVILSAGNKQSLWIPPEFGHGFLVLSDEAEFEYKCTDFYAPEHERAIRWDDPDIAISWPLDTLGQPLLSAKDSAAPSLKDAEVFQ